jgi:DNA-binding CsgD family transcriptional regulator
VRALERAPTVTGSFKARALNGAAMLAMNRGDFERGAAYARECLANCQEDDFWLLAGTRLLLGGIARGLGAYASSIDELNRAIELYRRHGPEWCIETIQIDLGADALGLGDYDRAAAIFAEALAQSRARNNRFDTTWVLGYLGLTACALGDGAAAMAWNAEAIPLWRTLQSPELVAEGVAIVATTFAHFGSPERSARLFGAADTLRDCAGHAFTLPELAFFERAQQSVRERLGERAYTAAFDAGRLLTLDQAIAETLAEEPTGPHIPRDADPYGLTPRELEVLALLAGRLTDPEIAEALSISPQTASTHVKRVLGKLGVSSRRDAAAIAARALPV